LLCEPSSVATPPGVDDTDAHVPLGDFLAQGLGESVHAELGEAVDAVAVPGDAAGDRADVDDVGDPARALFGGLQQVREGGAGGVEQALHVDGDHAV
jgi:hypothetical protein